MSKAQLVITAVVLEGRSKSEVARDYDVSRFWVQQLVHATKPREPRRSSRAPGDPTTTPRRVGGG
jgi:transposase